MYVGRQVGRFNLQFVVVIAGTWYVLKGTQKNRKNKGYSIRIQVYSIQSKKNIPFYKLVLSLRNVRANLQRYTGFDYLLQSQKRPIALRRIKLKLVLIIVDFFLYFKSLLFKRTKIFKRRHVSNISTLPLLNYAREQIRLSNIRNDNQHLKKIIMAAETLGNAMVVQLNG